MTKQMNIYRWLTLILVAGSLLLVLGTATEAFAQAEAPAGDTAADVAEPATTADGEATQEVDAPGWLAFFGRMHVVVLHLPIGILLGAFILELFGLLRRSKGYDVAVAWTLVFGTLAAAVAIAFGLFLEETSKPTDYEALTMDWHKWLGIAMGAFALFATVLKIMAVRKQWVAPDFRAPGGSPLVFARLSLLAVAVLLPVVGHLGGNLTHGPQKLVEKAPFEVPSAAMTAVYFPLDPPAAGGGGAGVGDAPAAGSLEARWVSDIQPILDAHCIKCHGPTKQNGELRLDSLGQALLGSGEYGEVIVTGSAELSPLYQVITLPPESDRFMPPGKDHALSLEDMRTIGTWLIDSANLGNEPEPGTPGDGGEPAVAEPAFDTAAAGRLIELGGSYAIESQGSDRIAVSFASQGDAIPAEAFEQIEKLAEHIYRLDFTASGVTDDDLGRLPDLPALDKLYLKDTAVTDAGLANLPEMFSIRYLNLFGAAGVTDAGLDHLEELFTLEEVYLSETGVTIEGVQSLREALGDEVEVVFDDTVGLIDTPGADAGAAADPTTPVNTVCPVSGTAVDPAHTVTYEGKLVGFCCPNCLAKFNEDPAPFLANLP